MRLPALLFPMLLAMTAANAQQQLYRWVDGHGNVHYSTEQPRQKGYSKREIAGGTQAAASTPPANENPQCATARNNLVALRDKTRPVQMTASGGAAPVVLTDAERAQQLQAAETFMSANHCAP